ncbi:MAG: hypothetical protein P4L83_01695 [Nevskia sp.]|nr:hypothetical protein [Nevskia sp.]
MAAAHKDALVADCVQLTERRIAARGGLRGAAVKTGMAMLKTARPDILQRAMQVLLPDFVTALDPLYQDFVAVSGAGRADFAGFLRGRSGAAVDALLGVADARVARVQNGAVKSLYGRLRGDAENEVGAALPELAALLASRLSATT